MKIYDNEIFKSLVQNGQYAECIAKLKDKIIAYVISKIHNIDDTIDFTTITDLITSSDFYLKDSSVARSLYFALNQENELEQIELLLSICERNGIK